MFSQIKLWLYAIGAALVGGLATWGMWNKKKAERLEIKAQTLEATVHADRVIKKIKKEKKEESSRRERKRKENVEKKDNEDFEGVDNLSDSNRW